GAPPTSARRSRARAATLTTRRSLHARSGAGGGRASRRAAVGALQATGSSAPPTGPGRGSVDAGRGSVEAGGELSAVGGGARVVGAYDLEEVDELLAGGVVVLHAVEQGVER